MNLTAHAWHSVGCPSVNKQKEKTTVQQEDEGASRTFSVFLGLLPVALADLPLVAAADGAPFLALGEALLVF